MFDFTDSPDWNHPEYVADSPEFDLLTARYIFFLYTHDDALAGFVRALPQVERIFQGVENGPWMVTLHPMHGCDVQTTARCYRAILVSMEAHLNPPLSDSREDAISQALTTHSS